MFLALSFRWLLWQRKSVEEVGSSSPHELTSPKDHKIRKQRWTALRYRVSILLWECELTFVEAPDPLNIRPP